MDERLGALEVFLQLQNLQAVCPVRKTTCKRSTHKRKHTATAETNLGDVSRGHGQGMPAL